MDFLINEKPEAVVATGERHLNGVADIGFLTVYYPKNIIGHVNVNWLSPVKVRTTLIGGEKKMLVWNDLEARRKAQDLRQGRPDDQQRGRGTRTPRELSLWRHVGSSNLSKSKRSKSKRPTLLTAS